MKKEISILELGEVIANVPFLANEVKATTKRIKEAVKEFYRNVDTYTPDDSLLPVINSLLKVASADTTFPTYFGQIYLAVTAHFPVGVEREYYSNRLGTYIIQTILYIELQYEVKAAPPYYQTIKPNYSNDDQLANLQTSIVELQNLFGAAPKPKAKKRK